MPAKFVLIGSGLAGGLLAAYLGRRGCDVDLYERRADPREGNIVGGRSINLAISTRGIHALEQIGIADEALQHAIPMRGRTIHDKSGALHFTPYDVDPKKCINSIGRASLNTTVIEAAQRYPNVRVHFNNRCTDVDLDLAVAHLETANGTETVRGDAVIGVDGAFSAVRKSMQQKIGNFQYDESYLAHGYKELTIPPGPDGSWRIEKNALHIWPRRNFRTTGSARSRNPFPGAKKTLMRLLIWPSAISSRCATKPRRAPFVRRKNSVTFLKPRCQEFICRFTRWSLLHEYPIPWPPNA